MLGSSNIKFVHQINLKSCVFFAYQFDKVRNVYVVERYIIASCMEDMYVIAKCLMYII